MTKPEPMSADDLWTNDALMSVNADVGLRMEDLQRIAAAVCAARDAAWQARCDALVAQAVAQARKACETALRVAREGYASEAITGLPVLPQWRERTIALIDEALSARTQGGGNHG